MALLRNHSHRNNKWLKFLQKSNKMKQIELVLKSFCSSRSNVNIFSHVCVVFREV